MKTEEGEGVTGLEPRLFGYVWLMWPGAGEEIVLTAPQHGNLMHCDSKTCWQRLNRYYSQIGKI